MDVAARVASAVPTPTLTVAPSPTPLTYTVQPGDTLYGIAQDLDIPLDMLMAANGLGDPNALEVGQTLVIPYIEGREKEPSEESQTTSPAQTSEITGTPLPGSQVPELVILGVTEAGNLETEAVRILNTGGVAHMAGWSLDDGKNHVYYFPVFSLHNGAVSVHSREGVDTVIDLYWGLDEAVWLPDTVVTLRDASGAVQATFRIPGG